MASGLKCPLCKVPLQEIAVKSGDYTAVEPATLVLGEQGGMSAYFRLETCTTCGYSCFFKVASRALEDEFGPPKG